MTARLDVAADTPPRRHRAHQLVRTVTMAAEASGYRWQAFCQALREGSPREAGEGASEGEAALIGGTKAANS
jgi:hypothetical protein